MTATFNLSLLPTTTLPLSGGGGGGGVNEWANQVRFLFLNRKEITVAFELPLKCSKKNEGKAETDT